MRRTPVENIRSWIRAIVTLITFLSTAISVLQLVTPVTLSDLFSNPIYYLSVALLMVVLMFWWVLENESKLQQLWNEEPKVLDVKDDRVEIISATREDMLKYGMDSSFVYAIHQHYLKLSLLYIDFINKPKVIKNNSAQNVQGFIEYYDMSGVKVMETYGRWIEMPEDNKETVHRYTEIPPDGFTKRRLGIAFIPNKSRDKIMIFNGDAVSHRVEYFQFLKSLEVGEYVIAVTISGSNFSTLPSMFFTLKSKDGIPSMNIKKDGRKWLKKTRLKKENLWK